MYNKKLLLISLLGGIIFCLNEHLPYIIYSKNPFITGYNSLQLIIRYSTPFVFAIITTLIFSNSSQEKFFKDLIRTGLITSFIIALTYIIYVLLFIYSIEPDTLALYKEKFIEINIEKKIHSLEEIESKASDATSNLIKTAILFTLIQCLFTGFVASIFSGILQSIFKKNN